MILVMRMLGEMAVANPSVGSFTDYTRSAIALFVYLLIAVAQLRMRRQLERDAPRSSR
ncbi:MAG TPA: hypothetical protein VES62_07140 [Thermoleophilaceae bacterium]|nr:hypothetical protein [Thermoleophilaceae bacterium]